MNENVKIVDYRQTEVGRQNWEVCSRMLAHDLVDMSARIPEIKSLCEFYSITVLDNGAHTMALPRREIKIKKEQGNEMKGKKKAKKGCQ